MNVPRSTPVNWANQSIGRGLSMCFLRLGCKSDGPEVLKGPSRLERTGSTGEQRNREASPW